MFAVPQGPDDVIGVKMRRKADVHEVDVVVSKKFVRFGIQALPVMIDHGPALSNVNLIGLRFRGQLILVGVGDGDNFGRV